MIKTKFATVDVVAAACVAYQANGNNIQRDSFWKQENGQAVECKSNKSLIADMLKNSTVTEQDRELAREVMEFLKEQQLFQTLLGKRNTDFLGKVAEACHNDETFGIHIGILAWAPKVAESFRKSEQAREAWAQYAVTSKHIGRKEGEKVECSFTVLQKNYSHRINCWIALGVTDEGNLISYFANKENKIPDSGKIAGKVKFHKIDNHRQDAKITHLNYVKVL